MVGVEAGVDDGDDHALAGADVPALAGVDVGVGDGGALPVGVGAGVVQVPAVVREERIGDRGGHRDRGRDLDARDAGDGGEVLGQEAVGGDERAAVGEQLGVHNAIDVLEPGEQLRRGGAGG